MVVVVVGTMMMMMMMLLLLLLLFNSLAQPQAEHVGTSDVVLTEKQFRSTHTVRWTVGFVELVADLAA